MSTWRRFVLGNVRGTRPYMSGDDVTADLEEIEDNGTLMFLNEMWRYTRAIRHAYPEHHFYVHAKAGCSTALVLLRRHWAVHRSGFWPLHDAVPGPRWRKVISDRREIAWTVFSPAGEGRVDALGMCIHQTPSAWEGFLPRYWKLRVRKFWYDGRNEVRARATAAVKNDQPVIIGGDWNHKGRSLGLDRVEGQRVQYVTASNLIDKFILIDSESWEWVVDPKGTHNFNLHSDHHGFRSRILLRRREGV